MQPINASFDDIDMLLRKSTQLAGTAVTELIMFAVVAFVASTIVVFLCAYLYSIWERRK